MFFFIWNTFHIKKKQHSDFFTGHYFFKKYRQGAKKVSFSACHLGTVSMYILAHKSFQTIPKTLFA